MACRIVVLTLGLSIAAAQAEPQARLQHQLDVASCETLAEEPRSAQTRACLAHAGCRLMLQTQKSCASAAGYIDRLQAAIGKGTRMIFGWRQEVTPDAVFTAVLGGDEWKHERAFGEHTAYQRQAEQIADAVRKANGASSGRWAGKDVDGTRGVSFVYFGQLDNGKPDGVGTLFFSNGQVQRGWFQEGRLIGLGEVLFPHGGRFIGNFIEGSREGLFLRPNGSKQEGVRKDGESFVSR